MGVDTLNIKLKVSRLRTLGIVKLSNEWHFGVKSTKDELKVTIYEKGSDIRRVITVTSEYKCGDAYFFALIGKLDGMCYLLDGKADPYAKAYVYQSDYKDYFGIARNELVSVFDAPKENRDKPLSLSLNDVVLYKLHVRGYTKLVDRDYAGTFKGLSMKVDYIKSLGINAILLMPSYEFHEVSPLREDERNMYQTPITKKVNYWGYTDGYYFAPKRAYACSDKVCDEFAAMVDRFHRKGIEVYEEFIFPGDMALNVAIDILRFWHTVYGIDGFRIMGNQGIIYALRTDPVLAKCKIIGTDFGADSYTDGSLVRQYDNRDRLLWYDEGFMEAGRHFLRADEGCINDFLAKNRRFERGYNTINFMADQNGFSLMDMVSNERKHNQHNGENNQDGRQINISFNCGVEGPTDNAAINKLRQRMVKNALAMTVLSNSVPMIMAGDEFGMSHGGNNNPYCQDNEINYIDWTLTRKNKGIHDFVKELISLRRSISSLRPSAEYRLCDYQNKGMPDLSYHNERAWYPNYDNSSYDIAMLVCGAYSGEKNNIYILYNMHNEAHDFAIVKTAGIKWKLVLASDEKGINIKDDKMIELSPKNIAVFVSE